MSSSTEPSPLRKVAMEGGEESTSSPRDGDTRIEKRKTIGTKRTLAEKLGRPSNAPTMKKSKKGSKVKKAFKAGAQLVGARIPSFSRFGQAVAGLTLEFPFASPAQSAPSDTEDITEDEAQTRTSTVPGRLFAPFFGMCALRRETSQSNKVAPHASLADPDTNGAGNIQQLDNDIEQGNNGKLRKEAAESDAPITHHMSNDFGKDKRFKVCGSTILAPYLAKDITQVRIHGLKVQIETEHFVLCGQEESLVPKDAMYNLELMFLELRKYLSKTRHPLIEDERFFIVFVADTQTGDNIAGSRVGRVRRPALQDDKVHKLALPVFLNSVPNPAQVLGTTRAKMDPYVEVVLARSLREAMVGIAAFVLGGRDFNSVALTSSFFSGGLLQALQCQVADPGWPTQGNSPPPWRVPRWGPSYLDKDELASWRLSMVPRHALQGTLQPTEYNEVSASFMYWMLRRFLPKQVLELLRTPVSRTFNLHNSDDATVLLATLEASAPLVLHESWLNLVEAWKDTTHKLMGVQAGVAEINKNADVIVAVKRVAKEWSRRLIDVSEKEEEDEASDKSPPPPDSKPQRWASEEGPSAGEVFLWTWRWMWANQPRNVRIALACVGYQAAWSMASMLLIEQLLINASSEDANPIIMGIISASILLGTVLQGHFQYIMDNAIPSGGPFVPVVQTELAKTLAKIDSNLLAQINVGEVMSILEDDVVRLNDSINAVFLAIQITAVVIASLFILIFTEWLVVVFLSICIPIIFWNNEQGIEEVAISSYHLQEVKKNQSHQVEEIVIQIETIKIMNINHIMSALLQEAALVVVAAFNHVTRCAAMSKRRMSLSTTLVRSSVMVLGAAFMAGYGGNLSMAKFVSIFSGVNTMMDLCAGADDLSRRFNLCRSALATIQALLDSAETDDVPDRPHHGRFDLELKDIEFCVSVDASWKHILEGITIDIPFGKKVAVVGGSGCGKSTLLNLVMGYYKATGGSILLGGVPTQQIAMHRCCAYMQQGALLFEMTIRDNILIGLSDEEAAFIDITRLCKISNLDWDLQRTDKGLDQEAGFQGKMLSTGMAQRVLLARTIARNRPILLLDEPCSAQEYDAVCAVGTELFKLTWNPADSSDLYKEEVGGTIIAVTHSLEMIKTWDMVVVLGSDGKISESGERSELLNKRGKFWYMVNQADGIKVDIKGHATITPSRLMQMWPFCSSPAPFNLIGIANAFVSQVVEAGETIYHAGSPQDRLIILAQGQVDEFVDEVDDGQETIPNSKKMKVGHAHSKNTAADTDSSLALRNSSGRNSHSPFGSGRGLRTSVAVKSWVAGSSVGEYALYHGLDGEEGCLRWPTRAVASARSTILVLTQQFFQMHIPDVDGLMEPLMKHYQAIKRARTVAALQRVWVLAGVDDKNLKIIGEKLEVDHLQTNQSVCQLPEDPVKAVTFIISGAIAMKVHCPSASGDMELRLLHITAGEFFGERLLSDKQTHATSDILQARIEENATVMTLSPSVVQLLDKSAASIVANNGQLRTRFLAGQYLRANWLFSALSDEVLQKCAQMFDIRAWRSSEQVIKKDLTEDMCFVILRGSMLVTYQMPEGLEKTIEEHPGAVINFAGVIGLTLERHSAMRVLNAEPNCVSLMASCSRAALYPVLNHFEALDLLVTRAKQCNRYGRAQGVGSMGLGHLPSVQLKSIANLAEICVFYNGQSPFGNPPKLEYPTGYPAPPDPQKGSYILALVTGTLNMTGLDSGQPMILQEGDFCYSSGATVLFNSMHRKTYGQHMVTDGVVTSDSATVVRFNLDKLSGNWAEEMRLLEIDMRKQMEEHTQLRVKARTLFQEVVRQQRRLGLIPEESPKDTWKRALLKIKTMLAISVDVSNQANHGSMESYLAEAEESQKMLDQLELTVQARLAEMHQWVQDWKACGECEGDPEMPDVTGSKLSPKHFAVLHTAFSELKAARNQMLDKMLRDARKLYHRLNYTVDEENQILKKLDALKAFPGVHDVPTPACFDFIRASMDECMHIILTPLPALRQEANDIYDGMLMAADMRTPLLEAPDTPETLDAMVAVVDTLRVLFAAHGKEAKKQHVQGHLVGMQMLMSTQLKKTQLLLKDDYSQSKEAVSDGEAANDELLAMMDEMGIEASQRKQFEKRFEEILRKQAEMDQLQEELQTRRQLSAELHVQLTDLHAKLGIKSKPHWPKYTVDLVLLESMEIQVSKYQTQVQEVTMLIDDLERQCSIAWSHLGLPEAAHAEILHSLENNNLLSYRDILRAEVIFAKMARSAMSESWAAEIAVVNMRLKRKSAVLALAMRANKDTKLLAAHRGQQLFDIVIASFRSQTERLVDLVEQVQPSQDCVDVVLGEMKLPMIDCIRATSQRVKFLEEHLLLLTIAQMPVLWKKNALKGTALTKVLETLTCTEGPSMLNRMQAEVKRLQETAVKLKRHERKMKKKAAKLLAKSQKQRHSLANRQPYPSDSIPGNARAAPLHGFQKSMEDENPPQNAQADVLDAEIQFTPQRIESQDMLVQPGSMSIVLPATASSSSYESTDGESDDDTHVDAEN